MPNLVRKLILVPHPVSPLMGYRGEPKERKILVVGRWEKADAAQKDPNLTMKVLGAFLAAFPGWTAEVVGRGSGNLRVLTADWAAAARERLSLSDYLDHAELIQRYTNSRILFCASRYESFHISSAEAVCCGCSVVVARHPLLASTAWFTTESSGTLAPSRRSGDLIKALQTEADQWERGHRAPMAIAAIWSAQLHAPEVAANLLRWAGHHPLPA